MSTELQSKESREIRLWGCLLVALTSCTHTTEVTVKDPGLVGASVHDNAGEAVNLAQDCKPCAVSATLPRPGYLLFGGREQRVTLTRDESGELRFEAPDTPGNTSGTLVTQQGVIVAPPSYLGADDVWQSGKDLRIRYMVTIEHGSYKKRIDPSFEIGLHTPMSNVARAELHTKPMRGLGVAFLLLGSVLTVASLTSLTFKSATSRAVGASVFGGFAFTFAGSGALLLALPETTRRLDLPDP